MRPTVRSLALAGLLAAAASGPPSPAEAATVKGRVQAPLLQRPSRVLGYAKTPIAAAAASRRAPRDQLALYLKVKKSLPLPPPSTKHPLRIEGTRFVPGTVACVFDESIEIRNADRKPVTVQIGTESVGPIAGGQTATFKCQQAGFYPLRLTEWPHASASLFVGEVGVAGRPDDKGQFTLDAPEGTYELQVIGSAGVIQKADVTVAARDVDLGLVGADQPIAAAAPEPEPAAAPVEPPPPPPPPPPAAAPRPRVVERPAPKPAPKPAAVPPAPKPTPKPAAKPAPKPAPEVDDFFELEE